MATTYKGARVALADNASSDDSVDFVRKNYPQVQVIINKANYGFARGYNEVLAQLEDDYFVLLNSDVEVQPGWVEPVIRLMESNKNIGDQWRFMADIFEPSVVTYHVFLLEERPDLGYGLRGIESLNLYPYTGLHNDCAELVARFTHYVEARGLSELLRQRQREAA